MTKNNVLLFCLIVLGISAAGAQTLAPYSFKASSLGMSIASFKEKNRNHLFVPFSHADHKGKTTIEYRWVVGPICNDEWSNAPVFDNDYKSPDEITCTMTWEGFKSPDYLVAGIPMQSIMYRFREARLFRIEILFYCAAYQTLAAAFEEKYGKPSDDTAENYQNRFGARWAGRKKEWKNGSESIVIAEGAGNGPGRDPYTDGGMAILEDSSFLPKPQPRPQDF